MQDKENNRHDEYRMPNAGEDSQMMNESGASQSKALLFERMKRLIIVCIVFGLFVFIFQLFIKKKNQNKVNHVKPQTVKTIVKKPTPSTQYRQLTTDKDIASIKSKLNELHGLYMTERSQMHHMAVGIRHIEDAISGLDELLVTIHKEMKQKHKQVKKEKALEKLPHSKTHLKPVKWSTFHLKAVVENRAWIETPAGYTLTVKVGDSVPDYGKITRINPVKGLLLTSSGRLITYGNDDA